MSMKDVLRRGRRWMNQLRGRDLRYGVELRRPTLRLGSEYGGWVVAPDLIAPDAVVYTIGVGNDISFDLALIERFGCTVHAFDPTPKAIDWLEKQATPDAFVFHTLGLADRDGTASFALPREDWVSYEFGGAEGADVIEAEVRRLSTLMSDLGHDHVDVVKMDIEGAEYDAIDDIIDADVDVTQLLIEFHHRVGDASSLERTDRSIARLREAGYRIFAVSPVGLEYSFLRT